MNEHVLSIDDFNMPKVFDGNDANYLLIIRLILLEPGKFQTHPEMGVGIKSRYRDNMDDDLLYSLSKDISNQIQRYLPSLTLEDVKLTIKGNTLGIDIESNGGSYLLGYNKDTQTIDPAATYLLSDL